MPLHIYNTSVHHYAAEQWAVENDDVTQRGFFHLSRELVIAEAQQMYNVHRANSTGRLNGRRKPNPNNEWPKGAV